MKEAQFVSILAHPRLDFCSEVVANQDKQLSIAYSLKGQNATSFCKYLASEFFAWQVNTPEQLHQKILDLLVFTRQKNLELEFALSLLCEDRIIFATYLGQIILKRNGQTKKILSSSTEIKIVTGSLKEDDQIILINQAGSVLVDEMMTMLEKEISLEKLVSDMSLNQENNENPGTSLAFLTYQEKIVALVEKPKFEIKNLIVYFHPAKKLIRKIVNFVKKIPPFVKKIYVLLKKQTRKKLLIGLGIFIFLIVAVFSIITIASKQKQKVISNIKEKIIAINQETQNIDQLVLQQPLSAREKSQKSLEALENLKKEKNNPESLKIIETEIKRVQELIAKISGDNSLDQLSIAFNLEDFLGKKIEVENDQVFVLENSGREILQITANQSKEKISLKNNELIRDFTISENKLFVLSSGIKMLDLETEEKVFKQIKEEGESDKNTEYLSSFGPYLYVLNREKRNIYRYYYNHDQLSDPIGWLVDKQGVNFDNLSDLTIDGDLWLGEKSGGLLKFSRGYATDFQIAGLDRPTDSNLSISSSENENFIAVLEKQNKRLLILTKDGQLIKEIKSNELAGVSSIALSSDGEKIYALSGSIVYEVNL